MAMGGHFSRRRVLFIAAAAGHHLTLLFGSFIFALPVVALALLDRRDGERIRGCRILGRTVTIVLVVSVAIAIVLLPFWLSLLTSPDQPDRHPACQPGKLHSESRMGP